MCKSVNLFRVFSVFVCSGLWIIFLNDFSVFFCLICVAFLVSHTIVSPQYRPHSFVFQLHIILLCPILPPCLEGANAHTHGHIWVGIHTYKCTLVDTHSTTDPISQHLALSFVHTLQSGFCKSAGFCCTVLHADGVGMRAICAASSILTTAACRWMQSRDPSLTCEARQNMWALNMVQIASLPLSNQHTDFCCCGFCFCSVRNKQVLHSKLRWWSTLMYRKQCHSEPC